MPTARLDEFECGGVIFHEELVLGWRQSVVLLVVDDSDSHWEGCVVTALFAIDA